MKKFIALLLAIFASAALFAEKPQFETITLAKPAAAADISAFTAKKLPALLSLKAPFFKGKLLNSNTISGTTFHRVSWEYKGIPVFGKFTVLRENNGKITGIVNGMRDFSINTTPGLTAEEAAKIAFSQIESKSTILPEYRSELMIIEVNGSFKLAYRLRFAPVSPMDGRFYFADAATGKILRHGNTVKSATNKAKVFEFNPKSTPDPIEIELPRVADDADGYLTSKIENGIRKIVVANCPDEGEYIPIDYGQQQLKMGICSAKQIANKEENGSFIYEDWTKGVSYKFDAEDIYAEVSAYYHMNKIYDFLLNIGLENFTELPNHNGKNPIVGVVNFQMDNYYNGTLQPLDNAFFSPYDPMFNEYYFPNLEYQGDMLVLGQGSSADFSYDGDVIYHEFGHGIIDGLTHLSYSSKPDKYGFSNESLGLNEGMADIFSFMITEDPCLGEYSSKSMGYEGCIRHAENENIANIDFTGESHDDGLPALAAHWQIYNKALEHGFTKEQFAKLFVSSLLSIPSNDIGFKDWAAVFVATTEKSEMAELAEDFKQIFEGRGFYEEIRARDITRKAEMLAIGGQLKMYGLDATDTVVLEDEEYGILEVAPMYVQLYLDVPECVDTLEITGMPVSMYGYQRELQPKLQILIRKDKPIIWNHSDDDFTTVKFDSKLETSKSEGQRTVWTISNLVPGERYYFQFINLNGPGYLYSPKTTLSWSKEEECTPTEPEPEDEDVADDSDTEETDDSDSEKTDDSDSKKSSGCSLSLF